MNSERERSSRAGRKHQRQKNQAFRNFEESIQEVATEEIFSVTNLSNPRIVNERGHNVAMVDITWDSTTEYLNYLSGNQHSIRENLYREDQQRFDAIMRNDAIRDSFEATRNREDNEKQDDQANSDQETPNIPTFFLHIYLC